MTSPGARPRKKLPIVPLGLAAVVILGAGFLILRGLHLEPVAVRDQVLAALRQAGPWAFFAAMALLPALGMPLLAFTIPAGEVFTARLGLPGVIAAALTALAVNLSLSYWLARYALRPVLARFIERYGYQVPRVTPANALSITLLVRLTPGPPYAMQCYVLGLAEIPFRIYLVVSWLCVLPWAVGAIVLGQGILNGNFTLAAAGLAVLAATVFFLQWLRRKYASGAAS